MGMIVYVRTQDVGLFSMYGSWSTALALFMILAFLSPIRSKIMVWLGVVSYSLYLLHPLVIDTLFAFHATAAWAAAYPLLALLFCIIISAVLAGCLYHTVERTAVNIARQLTKGLSARNGNL